METLYASPMLLNGGTTISSSTDATPIVVTTAAAHKLVTGQRVYISGHGTQTDANGLWTVTVASATTFSLNGSTGQGAGAGSGGSMRVEVFRNGSAELKVNRMRVLNTSGGASAVSIYDGCPSEFSGSTFASVNTAKNAVTFTDAAWAALQDAKLVGRRFVNNSQSYHIVGQEHRTLYLSGSASLDADAAWSIDGLLKANATSTGNGESETEVDSSQPWFGLWVSGTEDDIQVLLYLEGCSKVIARPTSTGFVGNNHGSRWITIA